MKKYILILVFTLAYIMPKAQDTAKVYDYTIAPFKYTVAVQPLYLFYGGLRFDFEIRLKNPKNWVQASVKGYYLPKEDPDYDYYYNDNDSYYRHCTYYYNDAGTFSFFNTDPDVYGMTGGGLELSYKRYMDPKNRIYLSGGLAYSYFNITYGGLDYVSSIEDGMKFYQYTAYERTQGINKVTANLLFGFQNRARYRFLIDGYVGMGLTGGFATKSGYDFNEHMYNPGYKGLMFVTGVRIGHRFGRRK